jgi:hypothetical protein
MRGFRSFWNLVEPSMVGLAYAYDFHDILTLCALVIENFDQIDQFASIPRLFIDQVID